MFQSARLKLTGWYLLIIMCVSLFFSIVIYNVSTREVNRFADKQRYWITHRMDKRCEIITPPINPDLVEETKQRILILLGMINGIIFLASAFFGYVLAGKTLLPIKEMVDEQNRFISDASHELRTPLTSLKTAMEVSLRDKNFKLDEAKTLIHESILEVNKLQTLAESLLQLAQYQVSNGQTTFERVELSHVIDEAVRKLLPLANLKAIKIEVDAKNQEFSGNYDGIKDLLVILLDNAIKYSPEKSTIYIHGQRTDRYVTIDVKDEGMGIKSKDIPYIFDRFYRSDTARCKSGDTVGYGLGLSIAKKIVDIHHGKISVKSVTSKGTTFKVRLPLKQYKTTK